jgi:hypothetical protein
MSGIRRYTGHPLFLAFSFRSLRSLLRHGCSWLIVQ